MEQCGSNHKPHATTDNSSTKPSHHRSVQVPIAEGIRNKKKLKKTRWIAGVRNLMRETSGVGWQCYRSGENSAEPWVKEPQVLYECGISLTSKLFEPSTNLNIQAQKKPTDTGPTLPNLSGP